MPIVEVEAIPVTVAVPSTAPPPPVAVTVPVADTEAIPVAAMEAAPVGVTVPRAEAEVMPVTVAVASPALAVPNNIARTTVDTSGLHVGCTVQLFMCRSFDLFLYPQILTYL